MKIKAFIRYGDARSNTRPQISQTNLVFNDKTILSLRTAEQTLDVLLRDIKQTDPDLICSDFEIKLQELANNLRERWVLTNQPRPHIPIDLSFVVQKKKNKSQKMANFIAIYVNIMVENPYKAGTNTIYSERFSRFIPLNSKKKWLEEINRLGLEEVEQFAVQVQTLFLEQINS